MQTVTKSEFNFHDREANLCELTKEVWRRYFIGSEEEIRETLVVFDPNCIIIGAGKHEFYESRDIFAPEVLLALKQRKGILFQLKRFWAKMRIISEDVRLVYGEIDIDGNIADGRARFTRDAHFSVFYRYSGDSWKIIKQSGTWRSFGVVYCDINGLKETNDTEGHDAGNRLIQECYRLMESSLQTEWIYRIGGDEFVAVYRDTEEAWIERDIDRLRMQLMQSVCQMSIGHAWSDEQPIDAKEIINRADTAMYEEKERYY